MVKDVRINYRTSHEVSDLLEEIQLSFGLSKTGTFERMVYNTYSTLDDKSDVKRDILQREKTRGFFVSLHGSRVIEMSGIPLSKDEQRKALHDTKRWREKDNLIEILESLFKYDMYECGLKKFYDTYMNDLMMLDPETDLRHYVSSNVAIVENGDLITPVRRIRREE